MVLYIRAKTAYMKRYVDKSLVFDCVFHTQNVLETELPAAVAGGYSGGGGCSVSRLREPDLAVLRRSKLRLYNIPLKNYVSLQLLIKRIQLSCDYFVCIISFYAFITFFHAA
jgi:hypothetical protein